jgi:hypothetical protein
MNESGIDLTFDSVMADMLDLLRRWLSVIRTTVGDIGALEKDGSERSKPDRAGSRWQMYLGTLLVKAAEGVADLAPSRNVRAMTVLMRAVYEYQVKAEYFLSHGNNAEKQLLSVEGRRYKALEKMAFPPGSKVGPTLIAGYLAWKSAAGPITEDSGQVPFKNMHLANVTEERKTRGGPDKVKTDAGGKEYTEEFATVYTTASWYAHGDVAVVPEVFRRFPSDSDWNVTEDYATFDELTVIGAVNASLSKFVLKTCVAYGFGIDRILPLREQMARTIISVVKIHRTATT